MVVFSPTFVVDTKIVFDYDFLAPLNYIYVIKIMFLMLLPKYLYLTPGKYF